MVLTKKSLMTILQPQVQAQSEQIAYVIQPGSQPGQTGITATPHVQQQPRGMYMCTESARVRKVEKYTCPVWMSQLSTMERGHR